MIDIKTDGGEAAVRSSNNSIRVTEVYGHVRYDARTMSFIKTNEREVSYDVPLAEFEDDRTNDPTTKDST